MARPLDPVSALLKLVDVCNACALVFRGASECTKRRSLQRLSFEIGETCSQFVFELQTEVRRIDDCDTETSRQCLLVDEDPDLVELRCEVALRTTLQEYEAIQAGYVPAHARAMIQRQTEMFRQLWERFGRFQTPAAV